MCERKFNLADMTASDSLHQLIHALTKNEKRYFKESSAGQNYLKLFDAINAQEHYDEVALKKKFRAEPFVKNLSVSKSYLYEAILRSLRHYNEGKQVEESSYERLQNIKLLYEKGLFENLEKQLGKLKQFCYDYELYPRILEILHFEMQWNNIRIKSSEELYDERLRVLTIVSNITRINRIYEELLQIALKHGHESQQLPEHVTTLMSSPVLSEENLCGERDELYALWNVFFVYHYIRRDFKGSYGFKKKQYELYKDSDTLLKNKPRTLLLLIGNLMSMAYNIPDKEEFEFAYSEMLKAHELVEGCETIKFEQRSSFGLILYKFRNDYSELDKHEQYIENYLKAHPTDLSLVRETDMYFNITLAFFRKGDFGKALKWLKQLLNHPRIEERQIIHRYSRRLEILIHFELGNLELLDYKLTNARRYLQNRDVLDTFDELFLAGFRQIIKAADKSERKKEFQNLVNKLKAIPADELHKISTEEFEYMKWLEEQCK